MRLVIVVALLLVAVVLCPTQILSNQDSEEAEDDYEDGDYTGTGPH